MTTKHCACCGMHFVPRPQVPDQAYCSAPGCQRARKRQRLRDANGADVDLAKMDVCDLPTGLYRITRHPAFPRENGDSWVVEITPVCLTCPCKMDVSREDLIDTLAIRP